VQTVRFTINPTAFSLLGQRNDGQPATADD
jgi:hypothetical protein